MLVITRLGNLGGQDCTLLLSVRSSLMLVDPSFQSLGMLAAYMPMFFDDFLNDTALGLISYQQSLVGGLDHLWFFHMGISSSQLTNSYFSEG